MKRGFTLIEMMVAVSLFVVVAFIATSAFTSFAEANRRAQAIRTNIDNLNFAMESIVLKIREGNNYDCGEVGGNTECLTDPEQEINFLADNGAQIRYKLDEDSILAEEDCSQVPGACISKVLTPIVSPEVIVKRFDIYVNNQESLPTETKRPIVRIVISGTIDTSLGSRDFNLQTTISQRP